MTADQKNHHKLLGTSMEPRKHQSLEESEKNASPFDRAMQEHLAKQGLKQQPNPEFDEMLRRGFVVVTLKPIALQQQDPKPPDDPPKDSNQPAPGNDL